MYERRWLQQAQRPWGKNERVCLKKQKGQYYWNSCHTIDNSEDVEATWTSINRGMDKEDGVHIHSRILLNHKKEWNKAICSIMYGPRDYHSKWSKSEREKQILYMNAHMWNLEEQSRWTYLQSRKKTDIEQTYGYQEGNGEWDALVDWRIYITMYKWITNKNLVYSPGNSTQWSLMT